MIPIFKNLEEALNSDEFTSLYNNVSWNNLMLHEIPEAERKLAYYLFLQGKDDSVKGLEYVLYKKKIPTIQDYLDNHLGTLGPRIFPQWRKDLMEIFDDQSLVWEVIFSGSIGCLSGDTRIPLLNGSCPTIKELSESWKGEAIYLYSYNLNTDEVTVGHAFNPHLTSRNADVYEIILDNEEKIVCTGNHPFLLKSKKYKKAEDLIVGESLMPLYRKVEDISSNSEGYEKIIHPNTGIEEFTHRMSARWKYGLQYKSKSNGTIHHKDFKSRNNDPRNLLLTDKSSHFKYHSLKGGVILRKLWSTPKYRNFFIERATSILKRQWKNEAWKKEFISKRKDFFVKMNKNKEIILKQQETKKTNGTYKKYSESLVSYNKTKHPKLRKDITLSSIMEVLPFCTKLGDISTKLNCSRQKVYSVLELNGLDWQELFKDNNIQRPIYSLNRNHKIKSIKHVGKQDVYDIQVLDHNNFATDAGVFVHNSGKTSIATIAQMYNLIRVSCLRNPQEVLGVMSNTLLFIMLISITLEKAGMALMNHFLDDLTFCDYFEKVKNEDNFQDFQDKDKIPYLYTKGSNEILFPNRIRIIFGSRVAHTLSYALIGAVLDEAEYRLCLSEDTEILSPDGNSYKIKDLSTKEYFYVYAYNHTTKSIDIAKATGSKLSKKDSELVRVTLDNDETIECTPDHRFMMRDGSYKEAKDLKAEDSLMPLYRKRSDESYRVNNYWMTLQPEYKKWVFDHELADNYNLLHKLDNKSKGYIRHHKDFNKDNNSPENIQRMTNKEHYDLHRNPEVFKKVRVESNIRRWKTNRDKMLLASKAGGKVTSKLYNSDPNSIIKRVEGLKEYYKSGKAKEQLKVKGERLNSILKTKKETDPSFKDKLSASQRSSRLKFLLTPEGLEFRRKTSENIYKRNHNKYHTERSIVNPNCTLCIPNNHRVKLVEYVSYTKDVYDISVPGYQNFALSAGVFVHNSGLSDAVEIYANLKERVRSRFLDKKKLILLTLISSARYEKGIIADMLKSIQKDKSSKDYVRYLAYPIWEVRQFNSYDRGHFYVMRGTKTYPSKILTETEQLMYEAGTYSVPVNCKVIKVPEEYRRDFLSNIELHLRNLAGEQTFGSEFLFDDLTKIEYDDLMPEITVELNLGTGKTILEQLPKSFLTNYNGTLRLSRYPNAPRYLHLDLAETAEAGIGICHKEIKDGQFIIVVDLACRVVTRSRIDLEEILVFIRYLKDVAEVKFNAATADRFQSAYILQRFKAELIADEKDVKILSMDKETAPYRQFSDLVGSDLFHIGKCPILKHQMEGVMEEVNENGKPHIIAVDKKDLSDAVGGCVVNALMCTRDVPIYSRDRVAAANIDKLIDPKRIMEL